MSKQIPVVHLPFEIQILVLENTEWYQFPSLALVCKSWRNFLENKLRTELYFRSENRDKVSYRYRGSTAEDQDVPENLSDKSPPPPPVSIHRALYQFNPFSYRNYWLRNECTSRDPKILEWHDIRAFGNDPIFLWDSNAPEREMDLVIYWRFPPAFWDRQTMKVSRDHSLSLRKFFDVFIHILMKRRNIFPEPAPGCLDRLQAELFFNYIRGDTAIYYETSLRFSVSLNEKLYY